MRLLAATLLLVAAAAQAQFPQKPIRIIIGLGAGGVADGMTRSITDKITPALAQPFVLENRPGAGGNIGTEAVARAAPDGYTLLMEVMTANAINATLYPHLKFNFMRDIAPVALVGGGAYVMTVTPSFPAKTVAEFIAYAKANPGKINMGSAGIGTPPHAFGELFKIMTGIDIVHIPYSGSYVPDLLSGQAFVDADGARKAVEVLDVKAGEVEALELGGGVHDSPWIVGVPRLAPKAGAGARTCRRLCPATPSRRRCEKVRRKSG